MYKASDRVSLSYYNLEFLIQANQQKYLLGSSQQLNKPDVRLFGIGALRNDKMVYAPSGGELASLDTYNNVVLTLQDPLSYNIAQGDTLSWYMPNTEVKPQMTFGGQQIDFTKSFWEFAEGYDFSGDVGKVLVLRVIFREI
jgi:hypothetical protein